MDLGKLSFVPVNVATELVGDSVSKYLHQNEISEDIWVSKIDPKLADTAAFCAHYNIGMNVSANCVIVEAKRADKVWYAACLVLATTRADINGIVRRQLDARKISFAPMDTAVSLSNMEYGGITPIGLPNDWPIFIDENVTKQQQVIIGSGIRGSKILVSANILASLPNAKVLAITKAE
jgi:prolyl-tRNA editing enzyme YbaK/EbsC (Cys-tRNA(Pro) deacylase)